jgi:hypothetical protein
MVETIDDAGHRWLWTFTSSDMATWETVGFLQHGMMTVQADEIADAHRD